MDEKINEEEVVIDAETAEEILEDVAEEVEAEAQADAEEEAEEQASEALGERISYIRELEIRLKKSQDTLTQYISAYKDLEKDKEEFMARLQREKKKDLEVLRGKIVEDLLVLMDNLDRSVMGAESSRNFDALSEGIRMVQNQFVEKLNKMGAVAVPTVGHAFDPNIHEALGVMPTPDESLDGQVVLEFTRGFMMGDRIIRPARVQVGKYSG